MTTSACPDRTAWSALLRGQISPDEEQRLQQHLDHCPHCQRELEASAGSSTFMLDLAGKLQRTHSELSPELVNLLDTAKGDEAEVTQMDDRPQVVVDPTGLLTPTDHPEWLGLIDAFEVLEVLGQGGMGVVFKAIDPKLRRLTAIKVLSPYLLSDQSSRQRFLREARAAAAVNHPHAVTIYAVYDPDNSGPNLTRYRCPYLVMEFVDGPSLQRRISRNNPLSVGEVLRISSHVTAALMAFHARGLIHRDVKPANILLDAKTGRAKLTDFGLTRGPEDVSLTKTGMVVGTPAFMSPEQAFDKPIDPRSDLFSLGSVMFSMLSGRAPFREQGTVQVMLRLRAGPPPSIATVRDDLPADLIRLIDRLHAIDPDQRPQSASEVLKELRRLRSSTADSAAIPSMTIPALGTTEQFFVDDSPPSSLEPPDGGNSTRILGGHVRTKNDNDPRSKSVRAYSAFLLLGALAVTLIVWASVVFKDGAPAGTETPVGSSEPSLGSEVTHLPFALLREDGSVIQRAETLPAALALEPLRTAVHLRIHGSGPYLIDSIVLRGRQIWIEAAEGVRPILLCGDKSRERDAPMIDTDGSLILTGIELHASDLANPSPSNCPLIQASGSGLHLSHCCLRGHSDSSPLIRATATNVSISHSMMFSGATTAISWKACPNGDLTLNNNLCAGFGAVHVESSSPPPHGSKIRLTDNTFVNHFPVQVNLGKRVSQIDRNTLPFTVERNQFRAFRSILAVAWSVPASGMPRRPEDMLSLVMRWGGDVDNVYSLGTDASWVNQRYPETDWSRMSFGFRDLPNWIDKWQNRETATSTVASIDFARGGLTTGHDAQRLDLSTADFRVTTVVGHAEHSGADVDRLGPGTAFELWRRSESARRWLGTLGVSQPN